MNPEDGDVTLPMVLPAADARGSTRALDARRRTLLQARIRRLMKEEPDVKAVTQEASLLATKAAELFLESLTAQALACKAGDGGLTYADLGALRLLTLRRVASG